MLLIAYLDLMILAEKETFFECISCWLCICLFVWTLSGFRRTYAKLIYYILDEGSESINDVVEKPDLDLADDCEAMESCFECEQKAGCWWCSSPERSLSARCSTKDHNEEYLQVKAQL